MSNINSRIIHGCFDCPFKYSDYDSFAIGDDTLIICALAQEMKLDDHYIDSYDCKSNSYNIKRNQQKKLKTPEWCPIKDKPLLLKFGK